MASSDEADGDDGQAEVDAFDLIDPVAILAKLPANFYEKIVSHTQNGRPTSSGVCCGINAVAERRLWNFQISKLLLFTQAN